MLRTPDKACPIPKASMNNDTDIESVEARFNLANRLASSCLEKDTELAKSLYLQIINEIPDNLGAWVNLGILLFETGYIRASVTAFSAAIAYHPDEVAPYVYLGNVYLYKNELTDAQQNYEIALQLKADFAEAHQGLASIFQRQGNEEQAAFHRMRGFKGNPVSSLSYRGQGEPIQLLVLASVRDGNTPWRLLIDRSIFNSTIVMVEYFDLPLPSHQMVFNAIGDADLCRDELEKAAQLLETTEAPVINHPAMVLNTGRVANTKHLAHIPGVRLPAMKLVAKVDFQAGTPAWTKFPFLLRSIGFHGGNYFIRVDSPNQLNPALTSLPGENLLAIEFLDSRRGDALFRKYRVMCIDGRLYPLHLAISTRWNVHYFSSDMDSNAQYRKEENAFLNDFSNYLGADAIAALQRIGHTLALDYCGIDFGMDETGNILFYEANSTMVINPPTHEERWDYKRAAIANALTAAKNMFIKRLA